MNEDYLLQQCSSPSPAARSEALESLAYRDRGAGAARIQTALGSDPDEGVRLTALKLLHGLGGSWAVQAVLEALADESPTVRREAEVSAGQIDSNALSTAAASLPAPLAARAQSVLSARGADQSARVQPRHRSPLPGDRVDGTVSRRVQRPVLPLPANAAEVRQWSRQCLDGSPNQRVKAATCLAQGFVKLPDLRPEDKDRLLELWAADCPVVGPTMAGILLNTGYRCVSPPRPTKQWAPTAPVPELTAKAQAVRHHHPEPREFIAHIGGGEEERCAAMHWLSQSGCREARGVLVERVLRDSSAAVAAAAADALVSMPPEDAVEELHRMVVAVTGRGRAPLQQLQRAARPRGPDLVDRVKVVLGSPAVHWHGKDLPADYDLRRVARSVSRLLASLMDPGLNALLDALTRSAEWDLRCIAAQALAATGAVHLTPLVEQLNGPDAAAQVLSAWVLARRRDDAADGALAAAMSSGNVLVRRTAALRLASCRSSEPLLAGLRDPDYVVRWLATQAGARAGTPVEALVEALDDRHPEIRYAAAPVLLLTPDYEHRIESWLAPNYGSLRAHAGRLQLFSGAESLERRRDLALDARAALAERVVATYSLRHDPLAQVLLPLLQLLYDRRPLVRHAAASALSELAPPAGAQCLSEIATHDNAPCVKAAAAQALKATATP